MSPESLSLLDGYARADLTGVGDVVVDGPVRREARAMLYGFVEYHLERRMRSLPLLARAGAPAS